MLQARSLFLAAAMAAATGLLAGPADAGSKKSDHKHHKAKHHQLTPDQKEIRDDFLQIDEGWRLFTQETFEGNGRTCATCHIPSESYNIFPETIKKLSKQEKALVFATNVPGLENRKLVKKLALFNIAGGPESDASKPYLFNSCGDHPHDCAIFRSSMGIFGLEVTTENLRNKGTPLALAFCSTPDNAPDLPQLGWSGDGSPGTPYPDEACHSHHGNVDIHAKGLIMSFANGAIAQHNPQRLARVAKHTACGVTADEAKDLNNCYETYDFRFATTEELAAMAEFQKWLGRRALSDAEKLAGAAPDAGPANEFDITKLYFEDSRIAKGRDFFNGAPEFRGAGGGPPGPPTAKNDFGAGCGGCHANGGARAFFPGGPSFGEPAPSGGPPPTFQTPAGGNINLNTEVEFANPRIGNRLFGFPLPHDEGAAGSFGPNGVNTDAVTGNLEAFNIQDVINSARKRGWFHNHRAIQVSRGHHKSGKRKVIKGFENAIAFYGSDDFSGLTADTFPAIHTSLAGLESGDDGTIASFPENDGIEHLGGFLRSLGAYYGLRNCERLVTEAISRIKVYVSPKLAIQHCKFELADVKRVLTESKLKPTPYKRVAQKASKLIQKMEKAAYERDIKGLKRVIRKLTRLRESIATVVVPAP